MNDFWKLILGNVARKLLTIAGTYLVTRGIVTQSQVDANMGAAVSSVVGGGLVIAGAVWTWFTTTNLYKRITGAEAALAVHRSQVVSDPAAPTRGL